MAKGSDLTSPEPAVSVIVPARNAAGTIGRMLESLAQQDLSEPFEVIVVDDNSDDETVAVARAATIEAKILHAGGGRAGEARNLGAADARAPALAFTDADCFPSPGWLREGLAALRTADLVQGQVDPDHGEVVGVFDRTVRVERETGRYETANLFVRREHFERVSGFDDWLFTPAGMTYGEDSWLGWRMRRLGARTAFSHEAVVEHAVVRRGPRGHIAERLNLVCIPALVERMPELRRTMLFGRLFLSAHTAKFDLAVLGLVGARRLPAAATVLAVLPYASWLVHRAATQWPNSALVMTVDLTADCVALGAFVTGSVRRRTLVL